MVPHRRDRIDGWWSRKTAIGDSTRARVLVFMQSARRRFPIERNGARKKPTAPTPKYALDNAVVVIEGMTKKKGLTTARLKPCPFKTSLKRLSSANCSDVRFGRRLGFLGLVGPAPAKQVSFVFGGHGGESHHAHDRKDEQENYGDYEDWHTSPLRPFWNVSARHAVIAITGGCEATPSGLMREGFCAAESVRL